MRTYATSGEIDAGRGTPTEIEPALVATVLGAVGVHPSGQPTSR